MSIHSKYFAIFAFLALLSATTWYIFYPAEPWIKYNFMVRSDEINAFANYVEAQSDFNEFSCIENDVWLDYAAAPAEVRRDIENHCRKSRIFSGERTQTGSSYYLGWRTRWLSDYWIAVIRATDFDDYEPCSRWRKPQALETCVVMISDAWAIHYFNATGIDEDVQEIAEDIAKGLLAK